MLNKVLTLVAITAISTSAFAVPGGKEGKSRATEAAQEKASKEAQMIQNRLAKTLSAEQNQVINKNLAIKDNAGLAKLLQSNSRIAKELSVNTLEKLFRDARTQIEAAEMLTSTTFQGDVWSQAAGVANLRLLAESTKRDVVAKEQIEVYKEVKDGSAEATVKAYVSLINKTGKHLSRGESPESASLLATLEVMQANVMKNSKMDIDLKQSDIPALDQVMVARAKDVQESLRKECKN